MSGSALLTLIAIVAGIEGTAATVEGEFLSYLRRGDTGRVHYEITVGNETRTIEVGTAEVVVTGAEEVQVRIASTREVLPGFGVRFEVPFERVSVQGRQNLAAQAKELEAELAAARAAGARVATDLANERIARSKLEPTPKLEMARADERKPGEAPRATAAEIEARVLAWAAAWSAQDAEAYLSFYSATHGAINGLTGASDRSQWEAQRRKRLLAPEFIKVEVRGFELLSSAAGRAEVRFEQSYRSNTFQDKVTKRLNLVLEKGAWKIISEKTAPPPS